MHIEIGSAIKTTRYLDRYAFETTYFVPYQAAYSLGLDIRNDLVLRPSCVGQKVGIITEMYCKNIPHNRVNLMVICTNHNNH